MLSQIEIDSEAKEARDNLMHIKVFAWFCSIGFLFWVVVGTISVFKENFLSFSIFLEGALSFMGAYGSIIFILHKEGKL